MHTRYNPLGLKFELKDVTLEGVTKTEIRFNEKVIVIHQPLERLLQSWYNWTMQRMYVQQAFHYLTADEREFLMTAITPEEWAETFNENGDE